VGWLMIALLACAVAAVIGAEWPRLSARYGNEARRRRERAQRKSEWKVLRTETEEFAASVERDLEKLPTIEETDRKH
jgi:cell division protein FtsL